MPQRRRVRLLRFDRIVDARVLDEPARPPAPAVQAGPDTRTVRRRRRGPSPHSARLLIDRSAEWMFDYSPLRVITELADGACKRP